MKHSILATCALLAPILLGVTGCQSAPAHEAMATPPAEPYSELTIDRLIWSDSDEWPAPIQESLAGGDVKLLGHVVEWGGFPPMKDFTNRADKSLRLVGDDGSEVRLYALTGGMTTSDGSIRYVSFRPMDELPVRGTGVSYQLVPRNKAVGAEWVVLPEAKISR